MAGFIYAYCSCNIYRGLVTMKKTSGSLPYFQDLSQENLFLKAELARSHQLIHELEASYFHQKKS